MVIRAGAQPGSPEPQLHPALPLGWWEPKLSYLSLLHSQAHEQEAGLSVEHPGLQPVSIWAICVSGGSKASTSQCQPQLVVLLNP